MSTLQEKLDDIDKKIADAQNTIEAEDPSSFVYLKALAFKEFKEMKEAIKFFREVISTTISFNLKVESAFEIIHIAIMNKDLTLMKEMLGQCRKFLLVGGDWEKKNKLRVYEGVFALFERNFDQSGKLFLQALMTFTNTELFEYKTFVFYTVITNIITVDRVTLKTKVIDNSDVASCIQETPHLQEFLSSFYNGNYTNFFYHFGIWII